MTRAPAPPALSPQERAALTVDARPEVIDVLRALVARRAPLTVYAGEGGLFIASHLLAVNPQYEELVFDCSGDEGANETLARSARLHFASELDGVRVQFDTGEAQRTVHEGLPALRARVPLALLRLQRREDFRIALPLARPLLARLPHPREPGRSVELRVIDLSCGGIALADPAPRVPLAPGQVLEGCSLPLPEAGRVSFAAEVRSVREPAAPGGAAHCGLRFLGMRGAVLAQIQRAVLRLERLRR